MNVATIWMPPSQAWLWTANSPLWCRCLGCLRGVSTLTAFGLAVEIGDWDRFTGPSIGAYLGLAPSGHSSGASRSRGSITKTGNGHARHCWSKLRGTTAGPIRIPPA